MSYIFSCGCGPNLKLFAEKFCISQNLLYKSTIFFKYFQVILVWWGGGNTMNKALGHDEVQGAGVALTDVVCKKFDVQ